MTAIMQPFQCYLQPQIQETHRTIRTQEQPLVAEHRGRTDSRMKRTQPHPPHTRGTFHRRLQPLYTEKHKVSCSGFLPKTKPMQHSCSHYVHSSPLPFLAISHHHHFPSSPLPFLTTSLRLRHHLTSLRLRHFPFPSSPLPIVTTSLRHHFPSSALPFLTTSYTQFEVWFQTFQVASCFFLPGKQTHEGWRSRSGSRQQACCWSACDSKNATVRGQERQEEGAVRKLWLDFAWWFATWWTLFFSVLLKLLCFDILSFIIIVFWCYYVFVVFFIFIGYCNVFIS